MKEPSVSGSAAIMSANATLVAIGASRTNFAVNHLRAAARAAQSAYDAEHANLSADFGPWFDEMILWVPVSVVMAGAALEADVNEGIQDMLDGITGLTLTEARKTQLRDLKGQQSGNAISKYRQLALLFDKVPNTGSSPWQNADLLVKFRNHFVHFRPAWDTDDVHSKGLVDALRKRRIPIVDAYKARMVFPYGFMTYGCAKWAVETVLAFVCEWTRLLGVKDRFVLTGFDFTLP